MEDADNKLFTTLQATAAAAINATVYPPEK
jgi:hypothetical protein